jgi:hypothetical protein
MFVGPFEELWSWRLNDPEDFPIRLCNNLLIPVTIPIFKPDLAPLDFKKNCLSLL